jgi:hypothetical protein
VYTIDDKGVFLDMQFFIEGHQVKSRLYQKPLNKYLYFTPTSAHAKHIMKNVVKQEINRYCIYCSNHWEFLDNVRQLYQRLLVRGYTCDFLDPLFCELPCRDILLSRLEKPKKVVKIQSLVATVNLPELSKSVSMKAIFELTSELREFPLFKDVFDCREVILGRKYNSSLGMKLVNKPLNPN